MAYEGMGCRMAQEGVVLSWATRFHIFHDSPQIHPPSTQANPIRFRTARTARADWVRGVFQNVATDKVVIPYLPYPFHAHDSSLCVVPDHVGVETTTGDARKTHQGNESALLWLAQ